MNTSKIRLNLDSNSRPPDYRSCALPLQKDKQLCQLLLPFLLPKVRTPLLHYLAFSYIQLHSLEISKVYNRCTGRTRFVCES